MQLFLPDEQATQRFGQCVADFVQVGEIIFLRGDLGVGKTCFARDFIRAKLQSADLEIASPTFSLIQFYEEKDLTLIHADFYRLKSEDELFEIGLQDFYQDAILLIEWPEIAQSFLPKASYDLCFSIVQSGGRCVKLLTENAQLKQELTLEFKDSC